MTADDSKYETAQQSRLRHSLYWHWWLREQMLAMSRQFFLWSIPHRFKDDADEDADEPVIVEAKGE